MHYPRKIVIRKRLLVGIRVRVRIRVWLGLGLELGLGLGLTKNDIHSFFFNDIYI